MDDSFLADNNIVLHGVLNSLLVKLAEELTLILISYFLILIWGK